MRACVLHGAGDLRVESRKETPLASNEVRLAFGYGGICGSDLHYLAAGRVGDSVVIDPMVIGHEFSGRVVEVGSDVTDLSPGDAIVVNPSRHCGRCRYCAVGRINLCLDMRYMGSAAKRPHEQGGFQERPVVTRAQCVPVPANADLRLAALAEPYAIALHALSRAGDVSGRRVLITGAGTIGTLCAIAAKQAGAEDVAITDVEGTALQRACLLAADRAVNVATDPAGTASLREKCDFDVGIEASGAAQALELAVQAVRPAGRIVQVGFLATERGLSVNPLLTKELEILGAYRFVDEFDRAVSDIVEGKVDLSGVITGDYSVEDLGTAFTTAADRQQSLKVLIHF